jgi:hypothetical protein
LQYRCNRSIHSNRNKKRKSSNQKRQRGVSLLFHKKRISIHVCQDRRLCLFWHLYRIQSMAWKKSTEESILDTTISFRQWFSRNQNGWNDPNFSIGKSSYELLNLDQIVRLPFIGILLKWDPIQWNQKISDLFLLKAIWVSSWLKKSVRMNSLLCYFVL